MDWQSVITPALAVAVLVAGAAALCRPGGPEQAAPVTTPPASSSGSGG